MAVGQQYLTPESRWKRFDNTNINIKYNGNWSTSNTSNFYNGSLLYTTDYASYIEFYFYGTKLRIYDCICSNRFKNIEITIDKNTESYSCYNSSISPNSSAAQVCVYEKENLDKTIHYVKIIGKKIDNTSSLLCMALDAIDIDEDGYMIYCDDNGKLYYDMTPIMTSNNTPEGYEVNASNYLNDTHLPYKVFNGTNLSSIDCWGVNGTGYIQLKCPNKIKISNFILINRNHSDYVVQSPKHISLYGSNDGISFNKIKEFDNIEWTKSNQTLIFQIDIKNYKYYKLDVLESTGDSLFIGELRYLLAVDTPFYIIKDNGVYKNYDEESNSLIEVEDTSILNENSLNNTCIYDLNKVSSLIDLKQSGVKILSNKNFISKIKVLKTNKQLILANNDFSTRIADNIDYFKSEYSLSDENCVIKTVISIDSGVTWYSYMDGVWTQLVNTAACKAYEELSDSEKQQWATFLDEVLTKGINIKDINTLDFNLLNSEKIRFAYAIQIEDGNSEAILKNIKWQFDSIGTYEQLSPKTEVNISMSNNEIKIQPLKDVELMKINVGISSQVPQVFDTSGLMDKETFKGKYEDSVKKADSIYVPDDVVLNSDYGIDINGNLGYHPRIPIPNEITSYIFPMLTKDIQQSLSIESEGINYMVQCYAKQPDLTNVEEVFESYANPIVTNHSDNVETVEDNGTKITQIKNNNIYKSTNNSETGFHELTIDFSKYIYINSIEEVDNDE